MPIKNPNSSERCTNIKQSYFFFLQSTTIIRHHLYQNENLENFSIYLDPWHDIVHCSNNMSWQRSDITCFEYQSLLGNLASIVCPGVSGADKKQ